MEILNVFVSNFKRLIKTPKLWGSFILTPALLFGLFFFMFNGGSDNEGTFALVIEDRGEIYKEIVELFGDDPIILTREEAEKELKSYNIKLVYLIDEDFSSDIEKNIKPRVKKLAIDDSGFQLKDRFINEKIVELMEESYLKSKGLDFKRGNLDEKVDIELINNKTDADLDFSLIILTVSYTIVLLIGGVGKDLVELAKTKVLSRILTTPNTNLKSIIGIFASYLVLLALAFNIMAFVGYKILDMEIPNPLYVIATISSMIAFSLSVVILIIRYTQDESMLSIVTLILSMAMYLTEIAYIIKKDTLAPIFGKLMFINPLYWIQRTLETGSFLNILPILLMSFVLLTFGSYRLENLQNL